MTEKEIIKILPKFNYDAEISENDILELKKTAEYLIGENIIKSIPDINYMLWK